MASENPPATKDIWAAFSDADFEIPTDKDWTEEFEDVLRTKVLEGEWMWLKDASLPIFQTEEDKNVKFPEGFEVGERIPVYCPAMGRQMDQAMYLVKTGENAWGRLNYNGKPHRRFLNDMTEPMSDALLKAETESGSFIVPNKNNALIVRGGYERLLNEANEFGMKPAAAKSPTTPTRRERDDFVKPLPTEGMDTHWMRLFHGELILKHEFKRAKGGSVFAMMKFVSADVDPIRVIVQIVQDSRRGHAVSCHLGPQ